MANTKLEADKIREIADWAATRRDFCATIQFDSERYSNIILALEELLERRAPSTRDAVLEEAAKVVENGFTEWGKADSHRDMLEDISANILALKGKES